MTKFKRTKSSRHRGSKTHGGGSMKKRRGAGNRGGRGNAGTGKRGDSTKPRIWNDKKYFGKRGFVKKGEKVDYSPVNLSYIESNIHNLLKKGIAKEKDGAYFIDLKDLGFNKLLSKGNITNKLMITTPYASKKSVEKINGNGGKILGLIQTEEEITKQ